MVPMLQGVVVNILWNVVLQFVLSISNAVFRTSSLTKNHVTCAFLHLPFNYPKAHAPVGNHHSQNSDSSSDWKLRRENTPVLTQFPSLCSLWCCPSVEPLCRLNTRCLPCPVARGGGSSVLLSLRHHILQRLSLLEIHCISMIGLLIKISLCLLTFH